MSTKDQLLYSALHGTAMQFAAERRDLGDSIAGLREIAGGRDDILAEAAGIEVGSWYAWPSTHVGHELIAAGLLIMAGGDDRKPMDFEGLERCNPSPPAVGRQPFESNRVELDDSVTDAWGLPVARITIIAHENDLAMGRFLIDRNAEILDAAGATSVQKVYIDRITGNCSHQHGTTRMGNDPESSVLDRWCRSHEVDNLFVVDGGPSRQEPASTQR